MGDLEPWKSVCRMRAMPGTAEPEVDRDITHLVHRLRFASAPDQASVYRYEI